MKEDEISVNRAKLGSITVYDVMEEELEIIEFGSPNSIYLNLAIAFITNFLGFLAVLLTVKITSNHVFTIFVIIDVISAIAGGVLLILWLRTYRSSKSIFDKIRARKNTEKVREIAVEDKVLASEGENSEQKTL